MSGHPTGPPPAPCNMCGLPYRRYILNRGTGLRTDYWCPNCDGHGSGCTRHHPAGGYCVYPDGAAGSL